MPDWSVPAEAWPLSAEGERQAQELAGAAFWSSVAALYASDEPKALSSAEPAAHRHGLKVHPDRGLREVRRPARRLADYAGAVREYLAGPAKGEGMRTAGWEPPAAAAERMSAALERILRSHPAVTVAVVSHGLVLSLFARRFLAVDDAFALWSRIPFGGYARVDPIRRTVLEEFRT